MDKNVKNILSVIFAILAFGACGYYIYSAFFGSSAPAKNTKQPVKKPAEKIVKINPEIDETTYQRIDSLKDYGRPTLEGIGKKNIFSYIEFGVYKPIIDSSEGSETTSGEQDIVCNYGFRPSDGALTLPEECESIADGRTIKKSTKAGE